MAASLPASPWAVGAVRAAASGFQNDVHVPVQRMVPVASRVGCVERHPGAGDQRLADVRNGHDALNCGRCKRSGEFTRGDVTIPGSDDAPSVRP
jgi:hypothetical protein